MTVRECIEQIRQLHRPDPDGGMGWVDGGYESIESACITCGTSDEYAVEWPCTTRKLADEAAQAADAALESSRS